MSLREIGRYLTCLTLHELLGQLFGRVQKDAQWDSDNSAEIDRYESP